MDEALYIYHHFYPCLCTFWHAIPTSLFIFNDFSFLYTYIHKVNGDTVNYSSDVPLNWDINLFLEISS